MNRFCRLPGSYLFGIIAIFKVKILFINNLYDPYILGGAERSVQILAEALAKNGDEPVVVSAHPNPGTRQAYINGVKVYYTAITNLYSFFKKKEGFNPLLPFWHIIDTYNPWMARKIGRIIDIEAPDAVHTNNLAGFSVSIWSEITRRKLPLIHTLRDYYLLCPRSTMFQDGKNCTTQCWYCRAYSLFKKRISPLVDTVVGISRHILNQHLSRGYFGRTQMHKVIYNAYPKKSASQPDDVGEDRPFRLGFLGQLKPSKGIQLLLQAVAELPGNDYELRIGGKGPEKYVDYLKTRYKSPNIYFLEFVDPDIFFSSIDLLIVPSLWHEPLGRTILEAYAHGVPVIGSNRGGIPELIDIGKTGYVFNPDHPDSLISLIYKIKQNPDLLVRMRNRVTKKSQAFLPERSLSKYLTLYKTAKAQQKTGLS